MKKIILIILVTYFLLADNRINNNEVEINKNIKELITSNKLYEAEKLYNKLIEMYPNNFEYSYNLGLLYINMKNYNFALKLLEELALVNEDNKIINPYIYNILGWLNLRNKDYEEALIYFNKALETNNYEQLDNISKMKVNNNKGFTLMLIDRYDEALISFNKAVELGSQRAKVNIDRIKSVLSVQKTQDENIKGVFLVILMSIKDKNNLKSAINTLAIKLNKNIDVFKVFKSKNEFYHISVDTYLSYPKAIKVLKERKKLVPKAYFGSLFEWELLNL